MQSYVYIYIYNSSEVLVYGKREDGIHVYLDLYKYGWEIFVFALRVIQFNSIQFVYKVLEISRKVNYRLILGGKVKKI
jgi:hypothetical protein